MDRDLTFRDILAMPFVLFGALFLWIGLFIAGGKKLADKMARLAEPL